jgi:hypothetical protein
MFPPPFIVLKLRAREMDLLFMQTHDNPRFSVREMAMDDENGFFGVGGIALGRDVALTVEGLNQQSLLPGQHLKLLSFKCYHVDGLFTYVLEVPLDEARAHVRFFELERPADSAHDPFPYVYQTEVDEWTSFTVQRVTERAAYGAAQALDAPGPPRPYRPGMAHGLATSAAISSLVSTLPTDIMANVALAMLRNVPREFQAAAVTDILQTMLQTAAYHVNVWTPAVEAEVVGPVEPLGNLMPSAANSRVQPLNVSATAVVVEPIAAPVVAAAVVAPAGVLDAGGAEPGAALLTEPALAAEVVSVLPLAAVPEAAAALATMGQIESGGLHHRAPTPPAVRTAPSGFPPGFVPQPAGPHYVGQVRDGNRSDSDGEEDGFWMERRSRSPPPPPRRSGRSVARIGRYTK